MIFIITELKYFHISLNIVVILAPGHEFFSAKYTRFPLTFMESNYTMDIFHWNCYYSSWDKPYQKTSFKSHSNTAILCKAGRIYQRWTCPVWFYFIFFVCAHFCNEAENANHKSHWNILVFYDRWNMMSDLDGNMMSDLVHRRLV